MSVLLYLRMMELQLRAGSAWLCATGEGVIDQHDNITDVDGTRAVGVAGFDWIGRDAGCKDVVDDRKRIGNVDLAAFVGIAANVKRFDDGNGQGNSVILHRVAGVLKCEGHVIVGCPGRGTADGADSTAGKIAAEWQIAAEQNPIVWLDAIDPLQAVIVWLVEKTIRQGIADDVEVAVAHIADAIAIFVALIGI